MTTAKTKHQFIDTWTNHVTTMNHLWGSLPSAEIAKLEAHIAEGKRLVQAAGDHCFKDDTRATVVVIYDSKREAIHFTGTHLQGSDHWFPFDPATQELFPRIENLLVDNGIANNVTRITKQRECGDSEDLEVVYNAI
ncbi:hypothetical protein [Marinimicrobium sp. ABcell2]|uniref:hypothetical protein n=1 Tax=Marinimicrobium sp. ABcell2 TaxID=3069751 RepID=UPI0027B5C066|nr:hypothetical protein [Marinimicrobium sp. ABcell2]MDQ2077446.1 hypothetical protein [Marinimicrobium sp. ABcell2]